MIISDFPRKVGIMPPPDGGGEIIPPSGDNTLPSFSYTGNYSVINSGNSVSPWKAIFTSSGTLTMNESAITIIQAQGGGGAGGAGYASGRGSDGADGSIESLEMTLEPGDYVISIGAAGSKRSDAAGSAGGDTSFGDLLIANGGAGGAYKGGGNVEHSGLYESYGYGGEGGTTSQYTGSTTSRYYISGTYAIYAAADPNSEIIGYMTSGTKYYVSETTKNGTDGKSWWVLDAGGYVPWTSTSSAGSETVSDNRSWYGNDGNSGIIILQGKV